MFGNDWCINLEGRKLCLESLRMSRMQVTKQAVAILSLTSYVYAVYWLPPAGTFSVFIGQN